LRLVASRRIARTRQCDHVDEAKASNGVYVVRPDEPGTDQAHSDALG
jgi:hypothetical protein